MTAQQRKERPVYSGVLRYFPNALLEIARVSYVGHGQHNEGPMRWDRSKSPDEADALVRHLLQAGEIDSDGLRHTAKAAWRALALLEKELEAVQSAEAKTGNRPPASVNPEQPAFINTERSRSREHSPTRERPSHDERAVLAEPSTCGCPGVSYPPGKCVPCKTGRRASRSSR